MTLRNVTMNAPQSLYRRLASSPTLVAFILLSSLFQAATASNGTCYFPNGVESSGSPCNPDAPESVCCGPGFVCLSNGLCTLGPDLRKTYRYEYYRSSCTDATWNSTDCPAFCHGADDNLDAGQGLASCPGVPGDFCCGRSSDCCLNSTNVFNLGTANIVRTIAYDDDDDSTSTATPSAISTGSPAPTNSAVDSSPEKSSNSVAIGVGVGVGVGCAIIILGVLLLCLRRRRKMKEIDERKKEEGGVEGIELGANPPPPKLHYEPEEDVVWQAKAKYGQDSDETTGLVFGTNTSGAPQEMEEQTRYEMPEIHPEGKRQSVMEYPRAELPG
ncbi:hypothetical protein K402DRAFT_393111 [Aulographum hederae CBS 113979]|uniref:Mid2 domain-containing protein n=1 Tax=Aulographum hederae CBS 113979 TaxID=1176131 RepID=A0A6G1H1W4_9PEZI|nr:hypothetical protein K402DRAFT_393111 [Aulographum hederae CBS 113979]